jgi:hypothetical protein
MGTERTSRTRATLAVLHSCLFAAFPIFNVVTANAALYPLNVVVVVRAVLVVVASVGTILWLLRFAGWNLSGRATWLSLSLLVASTYSLVPVPEIFEGRVGSASVWFNAAYLAGCGALAAVLIRPWSTKERDPLPLLLIAAVLLAFNAYPAIRRVAADDRPWQPVVGELTSGRFALRASSPPERDVYLIVLDTFGRADVLRDYYGLDLTAFVDALTTRGFQVPGRSRSNYSQTFLSLSSMLNLAYLDELTDALGRDSRDRRPLKVMIENNRLMQIAREAGYRVVGVGSDYTATETFPLADLCLCPMAAPHELEYIALRISPFASFGRERWVAAGRRRHVRSAFESIEQAGGLPGRKLVLAHILSPHPPFVFDRNGNPRTPPEEMPFIHEELVGRRVRARPEFEQEYVTGYSEQTAFVAARMLAVVDALLSKPGPSPAIMIVGDHGPALELDVFDEQRTNMRERMSIFSAYRLPGSGSGALPDDISPVNGVRTIAYRYLNVEAPPLPERSAFSTFLRPYDFLVLKSEE